MDIIGVATLLMPAARGIAGAAKVTRFRPNIKSLGMGGAGKVGSFSPKTLAGDMSKIANGSGGRLSLPAPKTGNVIRKKMNAKEYAFAQEIVQFKGGTFHGQVKSNTPGYDGIMGGKLISLKDYSGTSPGAVLKHVSRGEDQVKKAKLSNVDIYVNAKNVNMETLIEFATNGPLTKIPQQGYISNIYVQTSDGWLVIN